MIRTLKRRQGIFLLAFSLVTGAMAADTLRQRIFNPVYEGGFQIQISNPFEQQAAAMVTPESKLESVARTAPKTDIPSLIVLMRSPLLVKPVADRLGVSMQEVIDNLSINPMGNVDQVLYVALRWRDPVKGRQILNELSKDYTTFSKNQRQAALDSGVEFLNKQAPDINRNVVKYEAQLKAFREKYNILDPSSLAGTIVGKRDSLVAKILDLQVEQSDLVSKIKSAESGRLQFSPSGAPSLIEQMGRTGVIIPNKAKPGEGVAKSQTAPSDDLANYERQLATARAVYREDSPVVQSIKAQRDQQLPIVRKQATDALRAQLLANLAQQDESNRQIALLNENFRNSPAMMRGYDELIQKLGSARENYRAFVVARDNYRLQRARATSPWQVIAPAEFADIPVEPNLQRNLMRALIIGLIAGIGAAIVRERTDNVFHTPNETERDLQLPVLGLIPYLPLEPGVEISTSISKMSASERFAIKESLRSLFTTFRLLRADRDIRLVGVTSSTQGEGKSTAVTIFARTLADLGLKVLVVDSDLRLPMQTRYLGMAQGQGFSSLLTDSSTDIADVIQPIQDNLDVLPAGPRPPDPAKLLNSARAQEVINLIRDLPDYDIVLFDAPPCLMLADPILLGEKLDGILFLVGLGKVSRELAPQACRRIKATGVDVLGLICNQVNFPSRLNDYGYEYGYYYHYAYATANVSSRYASTYGKGLNRYAQGVGRYMKRYRDSYLADRYIRDGSNAAVRRYHEQGVSQELRESSSKASANGSSSTAEDQSSMSSNGSESGARGGSGGKGWLNKLKFWR
ncbi:MAG: GumC family protein [Cyanobium sp.]